MLNREKIKLLFKDLKRAEKNPEATPVEINEIYREIVDYVFENSCLKELFEIQERKGYFMIISKSLDMSVNFGKKFIEFERYIGANGEGSSLQEYEYRIKHFKNLNEVLDEIENEFPGHFRWLSYNRGLKFYLKDYGYKKS